MQVDVYFISFSNSVLIMCAIFVEDSSSKDVNLTKEDIKQQYTSSCAFNVHFHETRTSPSMFLTWMVFLSRGVIKEY